MLEKAKTQEEQELAKLEKAKKQEELENYQQQPDESELQNKLASLFSMVSLELNMEVTTKTLHNVKAGDMASNDKAGNMDFVFFKIKDGAKIKTKAKKEKLEPSLQEEGQQEQEQSLHKLQTRIDSEIIFKVKELSPILKVDKGAIAPKGPP